MNLIDAEMPITIDVRGWVCKCNEDSENEMELCHRVSEVSQRNGVEATGITLAQLAGTWNLHCTELDLK
jgi:hypothetical protein